MSSKKEKIKDEDLDRCEDEEGVSTVQKAAQKKEEEGIDYDIT
jgi:hypothetical protein